MWCLAASQHQPTTNVQNSMIHRTILCVIFFMYLNMKMSLDNVLLETHLFCRQGCCKDVIWSIIPKMKWKIFSEPRLKNCKKLRKHYHPKQLTINKTKQHEWTKCLEEMMSCAVSAAETIIQVSSLTIQLFGPYSLSKNDFQNTFSNNAFTDLTARQLYVRKKKNPSTVISFIIL